MNTFRVDRSKSQAVCPCGTNSILYIGDDVHIAIAVFDDTQSGRDLWGEENMLYGVTLSIWNPEKNEYVVKRSKGFNF